MLNMINHYCGEHTATAADHNISPVPPMPSTQQRFKISNDQTIYHVQVLPHSYLGFLLKDKGFLCHIDG